MQKLDTPSFWAILLVYLNYVPAVKWRGATCDASLIAYGVVREGKVFHGIRFWANRQKSARFSNLKTLLKVNCRKEKCSAPLFTSSSLVEIVWTARAHFAARACKNDYLKPLLERE